MCISRICACLQTDSESIAERPSPQLLWAILHDQYAGIEMVSMYVIGCTVSIGEYCAKITFVS